jgi:hypothetical protein
MGEAEHKVTVKNISISGLLVHIDSHDIDIKYVFNQLHLSTMIDFYLPEMHLAGEAQVVRADIEEEEFILLALEFKNVAFDIDENLNKRKVYRKSMTDPGKILISGHYYEFTTINVSAEGLMIFLCQEIPVKVGEITRFEFERLGLEGQIKVIWVDAIYDGRTLIGLEYVHLKKNTLKKRVPRFAAK